MHRDGYQIKDLREAVVELENAVPGLIVSVDWTEKREKTTAGRTPMVQYTVNLGGRPIQSPPWSILVVSASLAVSLRTVLGDQVTVEIAAIIDRIKNCSVT